MGKRRAPRRQPLTIDDLSREHEVARDTAFPPDGAYDLPVTFSNLDDVKLQLRGVAYWYFVGSGVSEQTGSDSEIRDHIKEIAKTASKLLSQIAQDVDAEKAIHKELGGASDPFAGVLSVKHEIEKLCDACGRLAGLKTRSRKNDEPRDSAIQELAQVWRRDRGNWPSTTDDPENDFVKFANWFLGRVEGLSGPAAHSHAIKRAIQELKSSAEKDGASGE